MSLGNRKSLFSCSWGWEEDPSSGESSVLPAEDPCTPSVALVTSILCLRGNFTSSQGLRELCQTHSLLLCELAQWGLWLQLQQSSAPLFSPWLQKGGAFCGVKLSSGWEGFPGLALLLCCAPAAYSAWAPGSFVHASPADKRIDLCWPGGRGKPATPIYISPPYKVP